ncbi:MmgE/PrpD family protein [Halomarina halobia]|uniref:MmgE/PrpD family protein n=1 Tax=Halomarina halobia TaxID=3033386 RepID=A0ABD6AF15_9EURY|nr:MmgE/PrpD family protein [Halomarina sp. PSR21]
MSSETTHRSHEAPAAEIASFVSNLTYDGVPADAVRIAERCFVDTVGVTLAGAVEGAGETAATAMRATGEDGGPASVLGRGTTASAVGAAFVNGTAGHGLDFDDVSDGVNGHPSVTLVAPTLAVGEAVGASGRAALTAFVAGFETECYLTAPISPDHYAAGWHATSTIGTFGAAAAAASLLDLDEERTAHAINIAASMPAGLKRNFGTMTKPMHAGQAARSGVTAAYLAADGFTADYDAIRDSKGFIELYGGTDDPDFDAMHSLGDHWAITEYGVGVKKYPCCYFTHTGITAASRLMGEHDLDAEDVVAVDVLASRGAGDALHNDDPDTGLKGKFSMQYSIASAIARDRVGLAAFDDENVDDPAVQAVREKVSFDTDPTVPYGSYTTTVTIETVDGSHSKTLDEPEGTHDNPLSEAELREKFLMCADRALDRYESERLYEAVNDLRGCGDVSDIF